VALIVGLVLYSRSRRVKVVKSVMKAGAEISQRQNARSKYAVFLKNYSLVLTAVHIGLAVYLMISITKTATNIKNTNKLSITSELMDMMRFLK